MGAAELLLKDPLFWTAAAVFTAAAAAFFWSLAGLRASAGSYPSVDAPGGAASMAFRRMPGAAVPPVEPKPAGWKFPSAGGAPAAPPPAADATVKLSVPAAAPAPARPDPVAAMVEEKVVELARKVAALEQQKKEPAGSPAAYLDPLLKRMQDMESELKNLKFAFTQLAAAQNAININDITAKLHGMQKVLENLTGGTDVSKPS